MCTLVILRRPDHPWPIVIGANRDEMIDRPALPPARHWPDRAEVVAGLDLLGGGSWLGVNDWGVVAAVLNRQGSLGPAAGMRSRGELVLEALDHADAVTAATALRDLDTSAYRTFNLVIADNRDAYWLRHKNGGRVEVRPIAEGLSLLAAGDFDDAETPRLGLARPRFAAVAPPDPERDEWRGWQDILSDDASDGALRFRTARGYGTVSSALIALPAEPTPDRPLRFRYAQWLPETVPWRDVTP